MKIMSTDCLRILRLFPQYHFLRYYSLGMCIFEQYQFAQKILQIRLLIIVNKNKFITDKNPIYLEQIFAYESVVYHYNELQLIYLTSNKNPRNRSIQIPKRLETISSKNSFIRALMIFNRLPNELKTSTSIHSKKRKLKKWVKKNI